MYGFSPSSAELVLESATNRVLSYSPDIPQLDGPIDDQNARSSFDDIDITIESKEIKICDYKFNRKLACVTPRKRKRQESSEDDDSSNDSTKKKSSEVRLPRTPRKSPMKKINGKLTSPSCPNRTYSPLSVEISKTPKSSPKSANTTPRMKLLDKKNLKEAFCRKNIFPLIEESHGKLIKLFYYLVYDDEKIKVF